MFKVEFGMIHENCPTNQMSRALPHVRFISPGGFELEGSVVEEVAACPQPQRRGRGGRAELSGQHTRIR